MTVQNIHFREGGLWQKNVDSPILSTAYPTFYHFHPNFMSMLAPKGIHSYTWQCITRYAG